jgi:hypothetical protein
MIKQHPKDAPLSQASSHTYPPTCDFSEYDEKYEPKPSSDASPFSTRARAVTQDDHLESVLRNAFNPQRAPIPPRTKDLEEQELDKRLAAATANRDTNRYKTSTNRFIRGIR